MAYMWRCNIHPLDFICAVYQSFVQSSPPQYFGLLDGFFDGDVEYCLV